MHHRQQILFSSRVIFFSWVQCPAFAGDWLSFFLKDCANGDAAGIRMNFDFFTTVWERQDLSALQRTLDPLECIL